MTIKKIIMQQKKIIIALALALLAVGCNKTNTTQQPPTAQVGMGTSATAVNPLTAMSGGTIPPKTTIPKPTPNPSVSKIIGSDVLPAPKTEGEQDNQIDQNTLDNIRQDGQISQNQQQIGSIQNQINTTPPAPAAPVVVPIPPDTGDLTCYTKHDSGNGNALYDGIYCTNTYSRTDAMIENIVVYNKWDPIEDPRMETNNLIVIFDNDFTVFRKSQLTQGQELTIPFKNIFIRAGQTKGFTVNAVNQPALIKSFTYSIGGVETTLTYSFDPSHDGGVYTQQ